MNAKKLNEINAVQIRLAEKLYGPETGYAKLLTHYETLYSLNMCTKHHRHDGTFFIIDEGRIGFKVIMFYTGGVDARVLGHFPSLGEAYSEVMCYK